MEESSQDQNYGQTRYGTLRVCNTCIISCTVATRVIDANVCVNQHTRTQRNTQIHR